MAKVNLGPSISIAVALDIESAPLHAFANDVDKITKRINKGNAKAQRMITVGMGSAGAKAQDERENAAKRLLADQMAAAGQLARREKEFEEQLVREKLENQQKVAKAVLDDLRDEARMREHINDQLFQRVSGLPATGVSDQFLPGGPGGGADDPAINARSSRKSMQALIEASRGFEDALISGQTGGLRGALRASANNAAQAAFILGTPMQAAIVGFGAALTTVLLPAIIDSINSTEDYTDALRDAQAETERLRGIRSAVEQFVDDVSSSGEIRKALKEEGKKYKEVVEDFKVILESGTFQNQLRTVAEELGMDMDLLNRALSSRDPKAMESLLRFVRSADALGKITIDDKLADQLKELQTAAETFADIGDAAGRAAAIAKANITKELDEALGPFGTKLNQVFDDAQKRTDALRELQNQIDKGFTGPAGSIKDELKKIGDLFLKEIEKITESIQGFADGFIDPFKKRIEDLVQSFNEQFDKVDALDARGVAGAGALRNDLNQAFGRAGQNELENIIGPARDIIDPNASNLKSIMDNYNESTKNVTTLFNQGLISLNELGNAYAMLNEARDKQIDELNKQIQQEVKDLEASFDKINQPFEFAKQSITDQLNQDLDKIDELLAKGVISQSKANMLRDKANDAFEKQIKLNEADVVGAKIQALQQENAEIAEATKADREFAQRGNVGAIEAGTTEAFSEAMRAIRFGQFQDSDPQKKVAENTKQIKDLIKQQNALIKETTPTLVAIP